MKKSNWTVVWNSRSSNKMADFMGKTTLLNFCNFIFISDNFLCMLHALVDIYVSEITGSENALYFFL